MISYQFKTIPFWTLPSMFHETVKSKKKEIENA